MFEVIVSFCSVIGLYCLLLFFSVGTLNMNNEETFETMKQTKRPAD